MSITPQDQYQDRDTPEAQALIQVATDKQVLQALREGGYHSADEKPVLQALREGGYHSAAAIMANSTPGASSSNSAGNSGAAGFISKLQGYLGYDSKKLESQSASAPNLLLEGAAAAAITGSGATLNAGKTNGLAGYEHGYHGYRLAGQSEAGSHSTPTFSAIAGLGTPEFNTKAKAPSNLPGLERKFAPVAAYAVNSRHNTRFYGNVRGTPPAAVRGGGSGFGANTNANANPYGGRSLAP